MEVVVVNIMVISPSRASAEGQSLHPFWWIADGAQCCVKTDKQHLQQWQPGTPSVPRSPAKSASVASHLLRPSSPHPLPYSSTVVAFKETHLSSGLST